MKSLSLLLTLASVVLSQQNAPQLSQESHTKSGALAGRVANAKTGEPIRRVNLTLRPFGAAGMAGSVGTTASAAPCAATTDAEGKFRIDKVEPGSYRLMAERQGFVRQEYGARPGAMIGTAITLAAGQELKDLNLKLTPQAVLTDRVLDEEGEPLARVQIQVLRRRFVRGKQQLMPAGGAQTLDTGEFRVADLAPGRYWINATYRGRMIFGDSPARNTAGKPEEAYVTTYYPNSVDDTGARAIDLDAGQELSGIDIRMQKARVYRIRGKLAGDAQPARSVRVMLVPRDRGAVMGFMGAGAAMVRPDGTFEIGSVQPGSYHVTAVTSQGMMSAIGKVAVDVTHEDVEDVMLPLTAGASLRGTVRIDGDIQQLEQTQGKKLTFGSVRVQLSPIDGLGFNVPGATAKDDGTFAIENAGPEKYRIRVFNLPQGVWLKSIRAGNQELLDNGVDLSAGAPGQVEVTLAIGVGQISGVVLDAKQQPASGSIVTLLPDPMKEERNDLYRTSSTDQNGQFTMRNIAPGDYKLFAWVDADASNYMDPEFLKLHESSARRVTVKANGSEHVTLAQIPADETPR